MSRRVCSKWNTLKLKRGQAAGLIRSAPLLRVSDFAQMRFLWRAKDVALYGSNLGGTAMKSIIITLVLLGGFTALSTTESSAVVCAAGVYRAGCVGVRGAAVVHRPVAARRANVIRR
jgi:hypothetical protein